jgi:hypothetical protein
MNAAATFVWYSRPVPVGRDDDAERERILRSVAAAEAYAVKEKVVIVRGPAGRTLMEVQTAGGSPIVLFTHADRDATRVRHFWMNATSVTFLGDHLRSHPELRVEFDSIFFNR